MTWSGFNQHFDDLYTLWWDTSGLAKPSGHKALLCISTTGWDKTTTNLATVTGTQVAAGNGYSTGGVALASHGATFDTGQDRAEGRPAAVSWTASGGSIQYDAIVILSTVSGTDRLVAFRKFGATQTIADGQTHSFTWEGNLGTATADVAAAD